MSKCTGKLCKGQRIVDYIEIPGHGSLPRRKAPCGSTGMMNLQFFRPACPALRSIAGRFFAGSNAPCEIPVGFTVVSSTALSLNIVVLISFDLPGPCQKLLHLSRQLQQIHNLRHPSLGQTLFSGSLAQRSCHSFILWAAESYFNLPKPGSATASMWQVQRPFLLKANLTRW